MWQIIFRANFSTVLGDNSLHDSQPKPCSAASRRKVWLEQSLEICPENPFARIGHFCDQCVTWRIKFRADSNFTFARRGQCFQSVIDQVDENALEALTSASER